MAAFDFGFQEQRAQREAEKVFWGRGCALCISILLLLPLFALAAHALDSVTPWQDNQEWYAMEQMTENPFVCQRNGSLCDVGWTMSSGQNKCWRLFREDPTTYLRAERFCERQVGGLAVVESAEQNSEVHRVCGSQQPCWIGLTRTGDSPSFQWADGSTPSYVNWRKGEPSSFDEEDYAVLGMNRVELRIAGSHVQDAVGNLFLLLVNVAIMTVACGVVYQALVAKSSSLLMCTALSDSGCAICCCLWVFSGFAQLFGEQWSVIKLLLMLLGTMQVLALLVLSILSLRFNQHLLKAAPAETQVTIGEFSASAPIATSSGQVVVGRPVQVQESPHGTRLQGEWDSQQDLPTNHWSTANLVQPTYQVGDRKSSSRACQYDGPPDLE